MCFGLIGSCPSRIRESGMGTDQPAGIRTEDQMIDGVLISTPTGWALMRGDLPASIGFVPLPLTTSASRAQAIAFCLALGVKVAS